jgi:hypothetical protein
MLIWADRAGEVCAFLDQTHGQLDHADRQRCREFGVTRERTQGSWWDFLYCY